MLDSALRFYGLLDRDRREVIELYATCDVADREPAEILADEPDWAERFEIVIVDFSGAQPNVEPAG